MAEAELGLWLAVETKGALDVYLGEEHPANAVRVPPGTSCTAADLAKVWNDQVAADQARPTDRVCFKNDTLCSTADMVKAYDKTFGDEDSRWSELVDPQLGAQMQSLIAAAEASIHAQAPETSKFGSAMSCLVDFCKAHYMLRLKLRKTGHDLLHNPAEGVPRVDARSTLEDVYIKLRDLLWAEASRNVAEFMK
jgi:hypothetical protein